MRRITRKILNGLKKCQCCKKHILFQGYHPTNRICQLMESKAICFDCAYWQDLADFPPQHMETIADKCYKILPEVKDKDPTIMLGGRGKRRYFMRSDLTPFKSNDIWLIGVIPERFKNRFSPTAFEIDKRVYNLLSNDSRQCQAIGCLDRYFCIRYKIELEANGQKPYNIVPKNWKAGDEHCKFFINRNSIKTDDSNVTKKSKSK